ncbi:hypothetical protein CLAC_05680 [Corynebacterium lactis RW2-5]|uniref:DUF4190 domain-containing protein n=2 Tax=Corynebacterium lactis TaxID=1231000 RepID=A0A0K2H045_9CORY|nr:hypothetical protein CLAC_05680 [Corynebacterium lactis RW2-5]
MAMNRNRSNEEQLIDVRDTYGPDGIDGSAVGRNLGLTALVLGIGGLLLSWALIGGVIGVVAIVLGVIAIVKSVGAKRRVAAAGREARTAGAFGLGLIGVITGLAAIAVSAALLVVANAALQKCDHLDHTAAEYQQCISNETGTDGPKR